MSAHTFQNVSEIQISKNEMTARVEVSSLRTAATSGGVYCSWPIENSEFDLAGNQVRKRKTVGVFEVGAFEEAYIFGRSRWNIIAPSGLYVEDIGYVQVQHMHKLERWSAAGGYYNIRDKSETLDLRSLPGKKFILGGDNAYWHWIMNWLPRMAFFDLKGQTERISDYSIVIVGGLPTSMKEYLYRLGVLEEQIVALPYNVNALMRDVVVPRFFDNLSVSSFAVSWLRHTFVKKEGGPSRRIYISRNDSTSGPPRRRISNEDELLDLLAKYNFKSHLLSNYSADQQISLFADAALVVAPHGAGLANMAFAKPATPVIVFENQHGSRFFERALPAMGHRVQILNCKDNIDAEFENGNQASSTASDTRNRDMIVDCEEARAAIEAALDQL